MAEAVADAEAELAEETAEEELELVALEVVGLGLSLEHPLSAISFLTTSQYGTPPKELVSEAVAS